ncbi:hypothetical protein BZA70DRAFT_288590 [Myxozyma melibiosi]|uniref:4'-phosphopantetheinyl transferase domain-containing protein n=1 Tax=Myxozyma melibiosi TaxID=54550 RepID=A0ABR1F8P9_9ASCO
MVFFLKNKVRRRRRRVSKLPEEQSLPVLRLPTPEMLRQSLLLPSLAERFELPPDSDAPSSVRVFNTPSEAYVMSSTRVHAVYDSDDDNDALAKGYEFKPSPTPARAEPKIMDISDPDQSLPVTGSETDTSRFSWVSSSRDAEHAESSDSSPTQALRERIRRDKGIRNSRAATLALQANADSTPTGNFKPRGSSLRGQSLAVSGQCLGATLNVTTSSSSGDNLSRTSSDARSSCRATMSTASWSSANTQPDYPDMIDSPLFPDDSTSLQAATKCLGSDAKTKVTVTVEPIAKSNDPTKISLAQLVKTHLRNISDASWKSRRASAEVEKSAPMLPESAEKKIAQHQRSSALLLSEINNVESDKALAELLHKTSLQTSNTAVILHQKKSSIDKGHSQFASPTKSDTERPKIPKRSSSRLQGRRPPDNLVIDRSSSIKRSDSRLRAAAPLSPSTLPSRPSLYRHSFYSVKISSSPTKTHGSPPRRHAYGPESVKDTNRSPRRQQKNQESPTKKQTIFTSAASKRKQCKQSLGPISEPVLISSSMPLDIRILQSGLLQMPLPTAPVAGLGVDILHLPRISALLARKPVYRAKFPARVLHPVELERYRGYRGDEVKGELFLGRCWAIKEALFKALDFHEQKSFQFKDWCTVSSQSKRPVISKPGHAEDERFLASVSHDGEYVLAAVIRNSG